MISTRMIEFGKIIFPAGSDTSRSYSSIGAQMVCLGIMFNGRAKRILSSSWLCWFGKMSWPVYLIHATLIRTLLTYMLYGMSTRPPSPGNDDKGDPLPRPWTPIYSKTNIFIAIPIFYVTLYRLALLWASYVDPVCGRVTNWVEYKIFRPEETLEE
jgi:hypothetical protein